MDEINSRPTIVIWDREAWEEVTRTAMSAVNFGFRARVIGDELVITMVPGYPAPCNVFEIEPERNDNGAERGE